MSQDNNFQNAREKMVLYQIEHRGITHQATISAMKKVPRHLFVPFELQQYAYNDQPLPIGNDQTISQPFIVAFMTSIVEPNSSDKVLEIGTGSGYQAAILAEIVDSVFTVEIVNELYQNAKTLLGKLGYTNIKFKFGDGYSGWKSHAPYDKIIVTAAADSNPPLLLEQLKENGKMIIPIGSSASGQNLILIEKKSRQTQRDPCNAGQVCTIYKGRAMNKLETDRITLPTESK